MSVETNTSNIDCSQVKIKEQSATKATIQAWLVSYLTNLLELNPDEVSTKVSFEKYGLDSLAAVSMTGDLEEWLGHEVDPALPYDYSTIESLARYLAEKYKLEV